MTVWGFQIIEILTALVVVVTSVYVMLTYRIAVANGKMVVLMQEQVAALDRPYIEVSTFLIPRSVVVYLRIKNTGKTRQTPTEEAAEQFANLAQQLRARGHDPQAVAHFINRLVFCMFAEDIGLLPNAIFSRMLEHAVQRPAEFVKHAQSLCRAMQAGGWVGFEPVEWLNGRLFDPDEALPLDLQDIALVLKAARLDWTDIDPSIFGTLFERGLDPDKRSQLGAHYTDRDKIMMLVDVVIIRPLKAEWGSIKAQIAEQMERAHKAKAASTQTRAWNA